MNETELRAMLPQGKFDTERVRALVALGYPAVAPVLPELLTWIQDINWPIAQALSPFLASIGRPLVPLVQDVFETNDHMWKIWVLSRIVQECPDVFSDVREQVEQMASAPVHNLDEEAVQEAAQDVLTHYGV